MNKAKESTCKWEYSSDKLDMRVYYDTECENIYHGFPFLNNVTGKIKYCPYCSKRIELQPKDLLISIVC